ncbi:MAG: AAA family ATPase [Myxococcales bacterium]|nr:AAA family ATPase [Myxococcales bacterium]
MAFQVRLFVREHNHGFYSVEVLGEPDLAVYTDDLDRARDELVLVLSDRIERTNPRLLGRFAAGDDATHAVVEVEGAVVVQGAEGPGPVATRVSALWATDKQWLRVHLPRWDLRAWIPRRDDPVEAVRALLAEHLERMPETRRLALRFERGEHVETLSIEAEPAAPIRFTGAMRGREMLPEPRPKEKAEKDEDEDDDDSEETGRRRKDKRPPTPTLDAIGVKLHRQAEEGELERAFGREREVADLFGLLGQPGACVVVVGEPGSGKSTVLAELAYRFRDGSIPKKKRRPVFFADASRLIAGQGFFGEWQRQCLDVVQECIDAEVVWCIGELHALLDAGKSAQSNQNVAMLIGPYLAGRRLTVVAEATPAAWARVELRDLGFARLFSPYRLEEPAADGIAGIVDAVADALADETGIVVRPDGRRAVMDLTNRFRGEGSRLGQALHFLRRVVDDAAMRAEQADETEVAPLGRHAVVDRFSAETGLPAFLVRDDRPLDPAAVRAFFAARIIGQREAIDRMVDLVAVMKAGLSDLGRPMGSFLFVGPTGVGKTEMSKALAEFLFGRRDRLIRFDMSEFVTAESVHRFLGDGGQEGVLIAQIRRQPFCVLLLDEIEKAHPAVFDVLLQVLGEARLTDQAGRTADFRNTVVLLTSNLGVETFKRGVGFGASLARGFREHFIAEAERFFRPEFFNRIDHVVPFMPLGADAIDAITEREIGGFLEREGIRQRDLHVELDDAVRPWLAERGVDVRYGARPLKRLIEKVLTAPLAMHLAGRAVAVGSGVRVAAEGEALAFTTVERRAGRGRAAARSAVRGFLDEVGALRWQVQQWLDSAPLREMGHAVRLVDRLARDRNFWLDRARAEARMRDAQRDRELGETFDGIRQQVAGIEDLAYEAFHDRSAEPLDMLRPELADARAALDEAELGLIGRQHPAPERVAMYLQGSKNGEAWLRRVLEIYVMIAERHGWRLSAEIAEETEEGQRARQEKNKPPPIMEDEASEKKRRQRQREVVESWAWRWKPGGRYERPVGEEVGVAARRKAREVFVGKLMQGADDAVRLVWVEGPHAAAWLMEESGTHLYAGGGSEGALVKVRVVCPGEKQSENPAVVMTRWENRRRRQWDDGRRLLVDPLLGLAQPIEPRVHRLVHRCLRASMYDAVFGAGAWRRFERDEKRASARGDDNG